MTSQSPIHGWLQRRPLVGDGLLALLLVVPSLAIPPAVTTVTRTPQSTALALAGCAVLVVRRRWPVAVWALTLALAAAGTYLLQGPTGVALPALVALYTVATGASRDRALGFAAASAAILLGAQAAAGATSWRDPGSYVLSMWSFLAGFVGVIVRDQRQLVLAAQERARAAEESREEEAQRRVAEERLRIARDLHDVVAHHIAVIQVQSGVAEHLLTSNPDVALAAIGEVRAASSEVLGEMGTLLGVLRPADPDPGREPVRGLGQLDDLVGSMRSTGLHVTVRHSGAPVSLAPLVDVTAYRLIEESLTNAYRHGTGSAEVAIEVTSDRLLIDVTNPGTAPSEGAAAPASGGRGLGLIGMRERVDAVGGTLTTGWNRTGRFTVHAVLPTSASAGQAPTTIASPSPGTAPP